MGSLRGNLAFNQYRLGWKLSVTSMNVNSLKMVWRKLGKTDMSVTNLTLRHSELEIRGDIIAQLVFCKLVLPPDVLIRETIRKYAAGTMMVLTLLKYF
jgi:hypothetical protein